MLQTLYGKRVILNSNLTVAGEPYEVPRSWKQRLFTRPWRPLKATKTVVPRVPSREVYVMADTIAMHPAMWAEIEKQLEKERRERMMALFSIHPISNPSPLSGINWASHT